MTAVPLSEGPLRREWHADRPVDLARTLGPLQRGPGDPAHRLSADGTFWWACATPEGDGTLALAASGPRAEALAWGTGAAWLIDRVPTLLGEDDDWSGLDLGAERRLHDVHRRHPGARLTATGLVLDSLVPAILEQRVTGTEAYRAWRSLLRRFGAAAPGPQPWLRVPPSPRALLDVPTWDWHLFGVDAKRQRAIRAAASVAARLEECATMPPGAAGARLRLVPGIGEWTAAETMQRVAGDPDAVSVGDFHLADQVVHFFTGRARGTDDQMLELLEPWAGQRQRIVRLIGLAGVGKPKFGPRFAPTDIRRL